MAGSAKQGHRVVGRRGWRGGLLVAGGFLVLSACASEEEAAVDATADEEVEAAPSDEAAVSDEGEALEPGGTLTFAVADQADCMDPHQTTFVASRRVLRQLYDNLVIRDADGTFQPWLATDWEISDDGTVYTFELRDDVTFHDGTPLNAEAVKFTFDRAVDPETRSPRAAQLMRPYESSEVVDEYTVEVTLQEPFAPFLEVVSTEFLAILSPDAYQESIDDVDYCNQATGSGPFVFVERQEGSHVTLERNEDYAWGPPTADNQNAPHIDRLIVQFVPEGSVREGLLQSGEAQLVEGISPEVAAELQPQDDFRILTPSQPGVGYHVALNESREPWDELDMRRAFFMALDVEGLVEALYYGFYPRAWGILTPATLGYHDGLEGAIAYDLEAASQVLEDAGWVFADGEEYRSKDGQPLTASFLLQEGNLERRTDMAVFMQEQLREVGIDLELEPLAQASWISAYQDANYDVFAHNVVEGDPDILGQVFATDRISTEESLGFNAGHFSDPEVDELLQEGFVTADEDARRAIYREIQERIIDRAGALPIYYSTYIVGQRVEDLAGLELDANTFPVFYDASLSQ